MKKNIKLLCAVAVSCALTVGEPVLAFQRARVASQSASSEVSRQRTVHQGNTVRKRSLALENSLKADHRQRVAFNGPVRGQSRDYYDGYTEEDTLEGRIDVIDQDGFHVYDAEITVSYLAMNSEHEVERKVSPGSTFTFTYLRGPGQAEANLTAWISHLPSNYTSNNTGFVNVPIPIGHGVATYTFLVHKNGPSAAEIREQEKLLEEAKKQEEAKKKDKAELDKFKQEHAKLLAKSDPSLTDAKELKTALDEAKKHANSLNKADWEKLIKQLEALENKLKKLPVKLKIIYVNAKGQAIATAEIMKNIGEIVDFTIPTKLNAEILATKGYNLKLAKNMPKYTVLAEDDGKEIKVPVKLLVKASKIDSKKCKYKTLIKYVDEKGQVIKTVETMLEAKANINLQIPEGYKLQDNRRTYHQAKEVVVQVVRLEYQVTVSYVDKQNKLIKQEKAKYKHGEQLQLNFLQSAEGKQYQLAELNNFTVPVVKGELNLQIKLKRVLNWSTVEPNVAIVVKTYKAYTEDGKLVFSGKAIRKGQTEFDWHLPNGYELLDGKDFLAGKTDTIKVKLKYYNVTFDFVLGGQKSLIKITKKIAHGSKAIMPIPDSLQQEASKEKQQYEIAQDYVAQLVDKDMTVLVPLVLVKLKDSEHKIEPKISETTKKTEKEKADQNKDREKELAEKDKLIKQLQAELAKKKVKPKLSFNESVN